MRDISIYTNLGYSDIIETYHFYSGGRHEYQKSTYTEKVVCLDQERKAWSITLHMSFSAKRSMNPHQASAPSLHKTEITREEYDQAVAKKRQEEREAEEKRLAPIRKRNFRQEPVLPTKVRMERPKCPDCGRILMVRQNKKSKQFFWACTSFPECKGTLPMSDDHKNEMAVIHKN